MRLGGCILLELAVGATLAAGTSAGVIVGGRALLDQGDGKAHASVAVAPVVQPMVQSVAPAKPVPAPEPRIEPKPVEKRGTPWSGAFEGRADEELLGPLRGGRIRKVKYNRGGSSISLRIEFEDGSRAAFKPDQTNLQTIPRKEVAAYRLSRLIGLGAVPPAAPRAFTKEDLISAIEPGSREIIPRLHREMSVTDDGMIMGELSHWIPVIVDAKLGEHRIDTTEGITTWKRSLQVGKPIPPEVEPLVAQISSMVAFDFLINNMDRWSGSNVKSSKDGATLYYMDNTLSFGAQKKAHSKVERYLARSQKFSRRLVAALRALDRDAVEQAMTIDTDPYPRLLTEKEVDAVLFRRQKLLEHIDALIAEHGEERVLAFP